MKKEETFEQLITTLLDMGLNKKEITKVVVMLKKNLIKAKIKKLEQELEALDN